MQFIYVVSKYHHMLNLSCCSVCSRHQNNFCRLARSLGRIAPHAMKVGTAKAIKCGKLLQNRATYARAIDDLSTPLASQLFSAPQEAPYIRPIVRQTTLFAAADSACHKKSSSSRHLGREILDCTCCDSPRREMRPRKVNTPPALATPAAAADSSLFIMQMTAHKHRQQPLARKGPKVINLGVSLRRANWIIAWSERAPWNKSSLEPPRPNLLSQVWETMRSHSLPLRIYATLTQPISMLIRFVRAAAFLFAALFQPSVWFSKQLRCTLVEIQATFFTAKSRRLHNHFTKTVLVRTWASVSARKQLLWRVWRVGNVAQNIFIPAA